MTSKMAFMVSPGNHDVLKHKDIYKLFILSFYSPQWSDYFLYFYSFKIKNTVFLSYNPDRNVY
jgi:hypothetical protein